MNAHFIKFPYIIFFNPLNYNSLLNKKAKKIFQEGFSSHF
ncbi:hypothetical protein AB751O23_AC_00390 [Chlamydiales bacterium SCGC AB-751-O23]|nr:hypothetical protein AB751O23_AC_00390 [Chlamydiales bacterium SCGC AB-751-O23]